MLETDDMNSISNNCKYPFKGLLCKITQMKYDILLFVSKMV